MTERVRGVGQAGCLIGEKLQGCSDEGFEGGENERMNQIGSFVSFQIQTPSYLWSLVVTKDFLTFLIRRMLGPQP